jgi:hypothetical protein
VQHILLVELVVVLSGFQVKLVKLEGVVLFGILEGAVPKGGTLSRKGRWCDLDIHNMAIHRKRTLSK